VAWLAPQGKRMKFMKIKITGKRLKALNKIAQGSALRK
jgi:hypothetical protein